MEKLKAWTGFNKVKALKAEQREQKTRLDRSIDRLNDAIDKAHYPPKRERNGTE